MGTDVRKRHKKLERRAAKRKQKRDTWARERGSPIAERMASAADRPIVDCWMGDTLWDTGIGWVVLSRALPKGMIAIGAFLVDVYCLGVKNALGQVLSSSEYESRYRGETRREMRMRDSAPGDARKLLEDAVAYARNLGFEPHPDYAKALPIFGSVSAAASTREFEFGKDGKPFFSAGPRDTPERCQRILCILEKTCGNDDFHFLMPVGPDFNMDGLEADPEVSDAVARPVLGSTLSMEAAE